MLTPAELAAALRVSTRTVARWDSEGCPCEWAGSRRRYDPAGAADQRQDGSGARDPGHTSIKTTERYAHVLQGPQRHALEGLSAAVDFTGPLHRAA